MSADALAPYVARQASTMLLTTKDLCEKNMNVYDSWNKPNATLIKSQEGELLPNKKAPFPRKWWFHTKININATSSGIIEKPFLSNLPRYR